MKDKIFYRLTFIPFYILLIGISLWMVSNKTELAEQDIELITSVIKEIPKYNLNDNKKLSSVSFYLENYEDRFFIRMPILNKIIADGRLETLKKFLKEGSVITVGVEKKNIGENWLIGTKINSLHINNIAFYTYEDFKRHIEKSNSWYKKYYLVPLLIGLALFILSFMNIKLSFFRSTLPKSKEITLDLRNFKSFELGEYKFINKGDERLLIIEDEFGIKIRIDLNSKLFYYRKWFGILVYSKFIDIDAFTVKSNDDGDEYDIYLNHKSGFQFPILNSKSSGLWFLDKNRKHKEKIEFVFLTIFNNVIKTP